MNKKKARIKKLELVLKHKELCVREKEIDAKLKIAIIGIIRSNNYDLMLEHKDPITGEVLQKNIYKLIFDINNI